MLMMSLSLEFTDFLPELCGRDATMRERRHCGGGGVLCRCSSTGEPGCVVF
jgi:hypothetical protein